MNIMRYRSRPIVVSGVAMSVFHRLNPALVPPSPRERVRASLGALTGIFLTGLVSSVALHSSASVPLLVAPMGASAVLLFAAPASPLAQPWSIIGGNLVASIIGVTCALFIPDPLLAAGLAVGLAIGAMLICNCLHPPSGAVALTAVMGGDAVHHAGYWFVLSPVGINSVIILATALLFNNVTGHRYPHLGAKSTKSKHGTSDLPATQRNGIGRDVEAVIHELDEVIDISPDDLEEMFHKAQIRAFDREAAGVRCADIMSRDVLSISENADLKGAWRMFMTRQLKALPVVDDHGQLRGVVSLNDFLLNSVLTDNGTLRLGYGSRLIASIRGRALPRTVADLMQKRVQSALPHTLISALVSPMVDQGIDRMPVVDENNRLVGMISQSDLLAALFQVELDRVGLSTSRASG